MITLHYPPERKNDELLSVTDQKNPCLYLLYSKLGLPSDDPTEKICWTERFYLKTSLDAREQNFDRPYEAVYDKKALNLNARLNGKIDQQAAYCARLLVAKPNALGDIERAKADPNWKLFTLAFDDGTFVPAYQQPFHGCVNVKTAQFHFYTFHSESILRHSLAENFLRLADMTVNLFAAMLGITTVRPNGFVKFTTSAITDPSLWKSGPDETGKHSNVLKAVILMRWVEKTYDHRFRLSQLSQALLYYALKEGLTLDDHGERSPVAQINRHLSSKSGKIAAAKITPDGRKQLDAMREINIEKQRALGNPVLKARNHIQRAAGFPLLVAANKNVQERYSTSCSRTSRQRTSASKLKTHRSFRCLCRSSKSGMLAES